MTELSFLLELLLNHKLRKETKDAIKSRIDFVSTTWNGNANNGGLRPGQPILAQTSPRMLGLNGLPAAIDHRLGQPDKSDGAIEVAPENIAQTPAAAAALAKRAEMMAQGMAGKGIAPQKFNSPRGP